MGVLDILNDMTDAVMGRCMPVEYEAMQQRHYDAMSAYLAAEEARKRKKRLQSSKLRRLASHGRAA